MAKPKAVEALTKRYTKIRLVRREPRIEALKNSITKMSLVRREPRRKTKESRRIAMGICAFELASNFVLMRELNLLEQLWRDRLSRW